MEDTKETGIARYVTLDLEGFRSGSMDEPENQTDSITPSPHSTLKGENR